VTYDPVRATYSRAGRFHTFEDRTGAQATVVDEMVEWSAMGPEDWAWIAAEQGCLHLRSWVDALELRRARGIPFAEAVASVARRLDEAYG
jgi:hypothetical protein